MNWIGGFVASGHIVDLILALTVLEAAALVLFHRATGRGVAPREFFANLVSGGLLLLAMRAYAAGLWWGWAALCLMLAGIAHSIDITRRWRA